MTVRLAVTLALASLATACAQMPDTAVSGMDALPVSEVEAPVPAKLPVPPPPSVNVEAPAPEPLAAPQPAPAPEPVAVPAAPPEPRTVWDRIRKGYRMPELDSPLVSEWESWYASRPDYLARMIERSSRILFHVIEEVERRGMPSEIALLPMIESAYNPAAYSRAHASGIWQFIPSTGKLYGLRQTWWYDGRRDIVAATNAALDYLEKLYGMFGSWDLALASYNWGEGAVSRAMARNETRGLPTDYMSLTMPAETRGYVPKLIAIKHIVGNPERYGLTLAEVPDEPYFATVPVKRHIDVKVAAKLAEIPLDEFKFLNPAHNRPVIKRGAGETIVLPKHKVQVFLTNLKNYDAPLVSWQAHTVKPGERPEKIAKRYGMSLRELKEVNGISGRKRIAAGQALLVPVVDATAEPHLPDLPAAPVTLGKAVKQARTGAKQGTRRIHQATVTKRHGAKARKVTARPAPAQKVRVAVKKRLPSAKKASDKPKPAAPASKRVMVAENEKEQ